MIVILTMQCRVTCGPLCTFYLWDESSADWTGQLRVRIWCSWVARGIQNGVGEIANALKTAKMKETTKLLNNDEIVFFSSPPQCTRPESLFTGGVLLGHTKRTSESVKSPWVTHSGHCWDFLSPCGLLCPDSWEYNYYLITVYLIIILLLLYYTITHWTIFVWSTRSSLFALYLQEEHQNQISSRIRIIEWILVWSSPSETVHWKTLGI